MQRTSVVEEILYDDRNANLTPEAKAYREAFCRQYVIDFNATKALIRCGWSGKNPKVRASQLMREAYVANRIVAIVKNRAETDVVARNQVLAKFWEEANDADNASVARVAALAHIAKMLGMFLGKEKDDNEIEDNTGVMGIPVVSVEDWANSAALMQANLKGGVITKRIPSPPPPRQAQTWN